MRSAFERSGGRVRQPDDGQRWMLFVDGENITIRGQETCRAASLTLEPGPYYRPDTYFWLRQSGRLKMPLGAGLPLQHHAIRASYYTSAVGDDQAIEDVRELLWSNHFTPVVLKKSKKDKRSKGVDISLTKDMLLGAFFDHYDVAVLASCDGDFEPLVQEVKRMGKQVHLVAFQSGLSASLRLACDAFVDLDGMKQSYPVKAPGKP